MASGKYTDSRGHYRTKSLFVEEIQPQQVAEGWEPVFTLRGQAGYIDIRELYLESNDPTEYEFAIAAFGNWGHLQHLIKNCKWFRSHLHGWREELEVKIRSAAIRALMETAIYEGGRGTTAAKYIAEKGWEKKRGRPSKEEVEKQKKIEAALMDEIHEDAERLGLH